jgi:alkanesulfonate monooxygenase SsuD/methylene tetrahydromethanopterin reductase-like flavin-dependent oxidoreductase (luciferase family)
VNAPAAGLEIGLAPGASDPGDAAAWHAEVIEQAVRAEALGFHSVWIPESHFASAVSIPSPLLLLAAIAARTQRIRLGTSSYLLPVRHPVRVAEDVAVLDQLSRGRVILGVGRGFRRPLFEVFGVPRERKRQRFEVALETIFRVWRGEPVAGSDVRVSPRPVQLPHPPVWVAAFGPKGLAQAAAHGLPYLASPLETLSRLRENHARHREALPGGLRDAALAVPAIRAVFVTRRRETAGRVRDALAAQAAELARQVGDALPHAGAAGVEEWALVGEPTEVAERIESYREAIGLTHLIARVQVPGASPKEVEASAHALAELSAQYPRAEAGG